jgi:hypothetical protein
VASSRIASGADNRVDNCANSSAATSGGAVDASVIVDASFFKIEHSSVVPVYILIVLFSIFVYLNPPPIIIASMSHTLVLKTEATAPIAGQKTGTSGLRKQVHEVEQPHYLENWLESLFLALRETDGAGVRRAGRHAAGRRRRPLPQQQSAAAHLSNGRGARRRRASSSASTASSPRLPFLR